MTCSNQCASCWASIFFCCNEPCAVLSNDTDEAEGTNESFLKGLRRTQMKVENTDVSASGAYLYIQAVSNSFREHFKNDEELMPVWESLSQIEILQAIYYMTSHRSSRMERGLIKPPPPRDGGVFLAGRTPLTSKPFLKWIHFAEIAYLEDEKKLKEQLAKHNHELVSFAASRQLFEPAYFISKSTKENKKLLVVGIKGTTSSVDWLTSLWIAKEELKVNIPQDGDDKRDFGVHGGVLHAARYLLSKIKQTLVQDYHKKGYDILFIGHSLGAGVACVCSIILREEEKLDRIYTYAYAPPPVVSLILAQRARDYVFSVINNDDAIPRTSMKQLKTLLANIRKAVDKKNQVASWKKVQEYWETCDWDELESEFAGEWREGRFDTYVAGRILFLYNLGPYQIGTVEITNDEDTLRISILSPRMGSDHFLDAYKEGLEPAYFIM